MRVDSLIEISYNIGMEQYRLPSGDYTTNKDHWLSSWRELIDTIEKSTGYKCVGWGNSITFSDPNNPNDSFTMSSNFAIKIARLGKLVEIANTLFDSLRPRNS